MVYLIPRRYRPHARIAIGVVLVILGIDIWGRIALVLGALFLIWGTLNAISRRRTGDYDRDRVGSPR